MGVISLIMGMLNVFIMQHFPYSIFFTQDLLISLC